jgi:hypothetical protein
MRLGGAGQPVVAQASAGQHGEGEDPLVADPQPPAPGQPGDRTFRLTSVLDAPEVALPDGIEATVVGLEPAELQRAALACADLLEWVGAHAAARVGGDPPTALAAFVRRRLQATTG